MNQGDELLSQGVLEVIIFRKSTVSGREFHRRQTVLERINSAVGSHDRIIPISGSGSLFHGDDDGGVSGSNVRVLEIIVIELVVSF